MRRSAWITAAGLSGFRRVTRYTCDKADRIEGRAVERVETFPARALPADTDNELALAARTDPAAFEPLYLQYRLLVYRYLLTRTPNGDEAAELAAVTFERALAGIRQYSPRGGGFRAWLLRIARNAAIDAARRRQAARVLIVDRDHETSPEVGLIAGETAAELRQLVEMLPPEQRDAVALRYSAGLTAREIGIVLGKSEAASQKLISRGLDALKEAYRVGPASC